MLPRCFVLFLSLFSCFFSPLVSLEYLGVEGDKDRSDCM